LEQSSSIPYGRISLLFVLILGFITWGFYKTYIVFFPSFTGFRFVQHFHGAMMMTWMAFLIIQPLMIRSGKTPIHRIIGKLSYVIAPLLMLSIFLVSRMVFLRQDDPPVPHEEKIANIALSIPDMLAFGFMYSLAIFNRRITYNHLRYMIGTSLLMIPPGLGRALIIFYGQTLDQAVDITRYIAIGIAAVLMINDIIRKKSFTPFAVVLTVIVVMQIIWESRLTPVWQSIGEAFSKLYT